ncbi:lactate utilization protein C [Promicromonospora sp. NPDC059942]|uniref:LutC/YkgG family protein n=1 Tax=Promicromonospora sp. NPDC059942 TaxID=3347009 RepID=UPI0036486075
MSDARTEILSRIRTALGTSTPEAGAVPAAVPREYRSEGEHAPGSEVVLDLLVDRLEDYKAHVHRVAAAELPALLGRLLAEVPARSVVVPAGAELGWLGALDGVDVRSDSRDAPLSAVELDGIDAVVTAARVAVAETGTIVLDGEPDQGRRAISLVPDVHVCVVRTDQVVQTVPEAVRLLDADPGRPLTWISGPSATSDIELDRVEGVHGPRTLHVALVS